MLTVLRHIKREYWRWELRAATGRSLVRHLLQALNRPAVLMPRYVPEGLLGPCDDAGVPVSFYDLHPDLTPDLGSIFKTMPAGALVVVIHYFGYPSPTCKIREMVHAANGILFEDCAQTLYGDVSKAHDADIALWSLNKFMPVTNGAILRGRGSDAYFDVNRPLQVLPSGYFNAYLKHLLTNDEIAKVKVPGLELACLQSQSVAHYEEYYKKINSDYDLYAQTDDSKFIESQFDYEKEKAIRVANAWSMDMILPSIRKDALPQFAYPMMCKSAEHREVVAEGLLKLGIIAARQVDKWNGVIMDGTPEKDFMDRHLLLPLGEVMDNNLIGQISGLV